MIARTFNGGSDPFACHERTKFKRLGELAKEHARIANRCLDPHARRMAAALRTASTVLWDLGGQRNVDACMRAAELSILAVQPVKLSPLPGAYLHRQFALAMIWAYDEFDGQDDPRRADLDPLFDLADVFWYRGDDKHARAAIAVLRVIRQCLIARQDEDDRVSALETSRRLFAAEAVA